jgi:hypothetical protein
MQIMSVNEKDRLEAAESRSSSSKQKVVSRKKVAKPRKKNSRERRNVDDFICGDDEIEYERGTGRIEREVSSR